jgi:ubiquinone/menaquinone biosynthesis C-methylase UbiE
VLEAEVMDEASEVQAYLDGVATDHLDRMDDTFVRAAIATLPGKTRRAIRGLDIGTGTGSIPVKMATRRPGLSIVGVDRSRNMLEEGRTLARAEGVARRVRFRLADGRRLPFPDGAFDLILSNSLLHHIPDPAPMLDEVTRVLKPGGAIFIRDLRRPSPRLIDEHIKKHGRYYRGTMLRLFADSVRAAFTDSELKQIVERSALRRLRRVRVCRQLETYLVIETS